MNRRNKLSGLYGITDSSIQADSASLYAAVDAALDGGMKILQYREKHLPLAEQLDQARQLQQLCLEYRALFIINDNVSLAQQVNAHGVHLGRQDGSIENARSELGSDFIVGTSCYNQLQLAREAQSKGVDYVAFGRFFPSFTKPDAIAANPLLITQAKQELDIPVCAIGGITEDNAIEVIEKGADMIAVINNLFAAEHIKQRASQFRDLF